MSKKNKHKQDEGPMPTTPEGEEQVVWDLDADVEDAPPPMDVSGSSRDEQIESLEAKLADAEARVLRAMADFQNFQRRAANNEIEARKQGVTAVVSGLLPVLDNFELALQQKEAGGSAEQILGGVEMVKAELLRALEMQGVSTIKPQPGDELNPGQHEAVSQMPIEGIDAGLIGQVFQVGYALGDRVLRPAKVVVASEPPADTQG